MAPSKPYHHGALRAVLIEAAGRILERDGPDALSLRALARMSAVSHAAPAHHFGDRRGLLTALATAGFQQLASRLADTASTAMPDDALKAFGRAYVRFARDQSHLFRLMFQSDSLDKIDAALVAASRASFAMLERVAGPDQPGSRKMPALASWCLVHGFSMLMIDQRLPEDVPIDQLLETVFDGSGMRAAEQHAHTAATVPIRS